MSFYHVSPIKESISEDAIGSFAIFDDPKKYEVDDPVVGSIGFYKNHPDYDKVVVLVNNFECNCHCWDEIYFDAEKDDVMKVVEFLRNSGYKITAD